MMSCDGVASESFERFHECPRVFCPVDDAENQATRGKVERLRLVMEERRERRRARREARHSPYGPSQPQHWTAKSETQPAGKAEAMDTDQPLCDISPPEPVVA